jgi:hypothetical protein
MEHSGSLTGHILAPGGGSGDSDTTVHKSRTGRVVLVMVLVFVLLIGFGVLAAMFASNVVDEMFKGILGS